MKRAHPEANVSILFLLSYLGLAHDTMELSTDTSCRKVDDSIEGSVPTVTRTDERGSQAGHLSFESSLPSSWSLSLVLAIAFIEGRILNVACAITKRSANCSESLIAELFRAKLR